jgi:hypothetical protein
MIKLFYNNLKLYFKKGDVLMKDKNCFKKNKKGYHPSYEKYEKEKIEYSESKMKPYYINEKKRLNEKIIAEEGGNSDYFEYKEISSSISNICKSLMVTGTKVWIKHIPTISYMKSRLLEVSNMHKEFINPLHIPDYLLNNLTFDGMSEDFIVIHPNEVKNKSQDFIDAIYTEMERNKYLSNDSGKPVISLLIKVKSLMEDGLGYYKLAEFANKYYSCEFANNSTIKIEDIRNRMLNSLADTAFAIEAERIKPVISESYIKVYIRSFIMEHASAYQELLNLAKPKRSTVISEENKK